jgi:hypothetical protein
MTVELAVMVDVEGALPARSRRSGSGRNWNWPLLVVEVSSPHDDPPHPPVTVKVIVWLLLLSASVPAKVTVRVCRKPGFVR